MSDRCFFKQHRTNKLSVVWSGDLSCQSIYRLRQLCGWQVFQQHWSIVMPLVCCRVLLRSWPVGLPAVRGRLLLISRSHLLQYLFCRQILGQRRIDHLCNVFGRICGRSGTVAVQPVYRWHVRDSGFGRVHELYDRLLFAGRGESVHRVCSRYLCCSHGVGNVCSMRCGYIRSDDWEVVMR
jgi:hypothetical protein